MNVISPTFDKGSMEDRARSHKADALPREIAGLMSVLLHLIDQRGPIVVYLTAASRGEGTTTIARELSAAATLWDWCKVALVDANNPPATDLYSPGLGLLDVDPDDGDLPFRRRSCNGTVLMEAALTGINTSIPRIDTVRSLFDRLRKQFTLVIVDSPPILLSQQTAAFSAAADCVVLVVEAERTRTVDLERARATLEQLGARILGIVLNKRRHWVPGFLSRRV
jgi:cellulose biosynthesis protein BcsQ